MLHYKEIKLTSAEEDFKNIQERAEAIINRCKKEREQNENDTYDPGKDLQKKVRRLQKLEEEKLKENEKRYKKYLDAGKESLKAQEQAHLEILTDLGHDLNFK